MEDWAQLQVEQARLEAALMAAEKALEALPPLTGHAERARLTTQIQALLAELKVVNAKLSALRGRAGSA